jgi:hypothetical protein
MVTLSFLIKVRKPTLLTESVRQGEEAGIGRHLIKENWGNHGKQHIQGHGGSALAL